MNCLVVKAHPLSESLCSSLAQRTIKALEAAGHSVEVEDLYAHEFAASLTGSERRSYYAGSYTAQAGSAPSGAAFGSRGHRAGVSHLVVWFPGYPQRLV